MNITVAIIGLGIMGRRMLEHMNRHDAFTPVALWDPDHDACQAAQQLCPQAVIASSADAAIDAAALIYLACPPVPRHDLTLMAAAAGKAVFLEKPLGVDVAASEEMVAAMQHAGVPTAVNFTQAAGAALADISQAA